MSLLKDLLLYIYWKPLRKIIQIIPLRLIYPIGMVLGLITYVLRQTKKHALAAEVDFIFGPSMANRERQIIVQKAFQLDALRDLEVVLFPVLSPQNIALLTDCEGLEHADKALAKGKGVMLLFSHFGANQMIMPAIGYRGYKMCQLSAPANVWKDVLADRKLSMMELYALQVRTQHEESLPVKHINIFRPIKEALRCLQRNEVLGVAIDGGGGKERIPVDFLGKEALLSPGPADIARKMGCTVLPTFVLRDRKGRNRVIIEPPLEFNKNGDSQNARHSFTQAFAARLADYVTVHPEYYIGFMALRSYMSQRGDTPLFAKQAAIVAAG